MIHCRHFAWQCVEWQYYEFYRIVLRQNIGLATVFYLSSHFWRFVLCEQGIWQQFNIAIPMVIVRYFNAVAMAIIGTSSPTSPDLRYVWYSWFPAHRRCRGCNDENFFQRTDIHLSVHFAMIVACRKNILSLEGFRRSKREKHIEYCDFHHVE